MNELHMLYIYYSHAMGFKFQLLGLMLNQYNICLFSLYHVI
jgi:hypothetical protein